MTRLKENDVSTIEKNLTDHNNYLREMTGSNLIDIGWHALSCNPDRVNQPTDFIISVIPVTSGMGRITGFSEAVASILNSLGFKAQTSKKTDIAGLYDAYSADVDGVFLADDNDYIAINLRSKKIMHNNIATGHGFAAALDLILQGATDEEVLVMGCGKVGTAAAEKLLEYGYSLLLYDIRNSMATHLQNMLYRNNFSGEVRVINDLTDEAPPCSAILEATPSANSLDQINYATVKAVSAAGVPSVLPPNLLRSNTRFIHDKLELGTTVMALSLLIP